ncbi:hypothetical protein [Streptomyces xinghaiensis]|uniref:hypothetical protein n=1 Tax=Streptomyces xinghaiensis TaxID=1038928 RepID=UPI0005850C5C|nr:hypothetical protein [Streptomyces xinghaiensis]MZE80609.1 hypothetical protein [Streptomyces sp. SID5475]
MIGLRIGPPAAVQVGRMGLLLGLVVLIAAHLAGHVHGPGFTGSRGQVGASSCAHLTAWGSGTPPEPEHGDGQDHEHDHGSHHDHGSDHDQDQDHADGHVDHAVDRPRAVAPPHAVTAWSPDVSGMSPYPSWLPAADAQQAPFSGSALEGSRGGPRAPDGRSALALHCVWRQ